MERRDALVREEFTRQADAFAAAALFNDETILARICEAARLAPRSRALDVGCGPGIVTEALARSAGEVVGCDLTPAMLERARERADKAGLRNATFLPARAETLPFADASFDVVASRSAVHHFTDAAVVLREMTRVLRPGGRLVTVDVMASETAEEAALHNALETLRDPSHVRMLSRSTLHRLLGQCGLTVESCVVWVNAREFDEWMKIVTAPERVGPLRTVMTALAERGAQAGIGLRVEADTLRFEHTAGLTVAVKP